MKRGLTIRLTAVLVCLLAAAILLTGCTPAAKAPAPAVPPGPKAGGILKIALPGTAASLDSFVVQTNASYAYGVLKIFNQPLLRWSGKSDRDVKIEPLIVKAWEISPDGLTYTFHLQEGVKWQNLPPLNGRELTADDFVYHLNRIMDPANKNPAASALDIKTAKAVDKYTLVVTTNTKVPGFPGYCSNGSMSPSPKEVVEAPGGAGKNLVGTGPFIITAFDPSVKVILKKNPDYWQKEKPYLDGVEIYYMPDAAARLAAFRAGQIDVLPSEPKTNRDAIENSVPGSQIQDGVSMIEAGLNINNARKPFDNKQVRQAIQYAIDYDGLIKSALDGAGMRTGYLAPWFGEWGARQPDSLPKYDIEKAKALLAEAGYAGGFKTTILMNVSSMDFVGSAVEPITAMLKRVGIEATIVTADVATFQSKWRTMDFDMAVWNLYTSRPLDPDVSLQPQWATKGTANRLGYSNTKIDQLIAAQRAAFPDKEKRIPIVKQILSILEDDVPSIPLYIRTNYFIKQSWVKGWDEMSDPQGQFATYQLPFVWVDKK